MPLGRDVFGTLRVPSRPLAPAFLLTAACCRWPPSDDRNAAIAAATVAVSDWTDFLREVRRQRVVGLVHAALSPAAAASIRPAVPSAILADLKLRAQQIVRQNLRFATETVRLQNAFDAAGIANLVLKGAALAQLAYGSTTIKQARDIDLLVSPDRAEIALELLECAGYILAAPATRLSTRQSSDLIRYGREIELYHPDRKTRVELQWRASSNPHLLWGVDAHTRAQSVALPGGACVRTLATDDLFAYLSVHGARHAWSRLKWLADLQALVAAQGAEVTRLYHYAQSIGAAHCAGQALLLCRQLLALPLPADLADEISRSRKTRKLVTIARAAMTAAKAENDGDGGIAGVARSVHTQFRLGHGAAFYLAQFRTAAIAPTDIVRWPLPRYLHFLYPLLRLPLWLWRRAAIMIGGA